MLVRDVMKRRVRVLEEGRSPRVGNRRDAVPVPAPHPRPGPVELLASLNHNATLRHEAGRGGWPGSRSGGARLPRGSRGRDAYATAGRRSRFRSHSRHSQEQLLRDSRDEARSFKRPFREIEKRLASCCSEVWVEPRASEDQRPPSQERRRRVRLRRPLARNRRRRMGADRESLAHPAGCTRGAPRRALSRWAVPGAAGSYRRAAPA